MSTVKTLFSKTPKFTLDISSLTDDNNSYLANTNSVTSTGPAASASRDNVTKRSAPSSSHDNVPKRSSKSKSERSHGNCKFLEKSANLMV